MLKSRYVYTGMSAKCKKRYFELGYDVSKKRIKVKIQDLLPNSNMNVCMQCETCNKKHIVRFSRSHIICGNCVLSTRMKGNTYTKLPLPDIPDKEHILDLVYNKKYGQKKLSVHYNKSYNEIKRILKHYQIDVPKHHGKFKYLPDDFIETFSNTSDYNSLCKKYRVRKQLVGKWIKQAGLSYTGPTTKKEKPSREQLFLDNHLSKLTSEQIAEKYNVSCSVVVKWFASYDLPIKQYGNNTSKMEIEVLEYCNFRGNHFMKTKSVLDNRYLELDMYDKNLSVAFEFCGLYWHSNPKDKNSHAMKYFAAKDKDIQLYTIFEHEWVYKKDLVKSMIDSRCGKNTNRIFARKCEIRKLLNEETKQFLEANHIAGHTRYQLTYGLFHNDKLVSCMTFVKSRYDRKHEWEISRFCSKKYTTVVGGAQKLFNYFIKDNNPNSVLSYADLRWGHGNVYQKCGFSFQGYTRPNYFYFKERTIHLESRLKYQKHKCKKILSGFDENLTELENMKNHNYRVIYDCGNAKWLWTKP